jgi:urocanate hydratase
MAPTAERPVIAQRGLQLRCRGWRQEGVLRMLENVLEVGERPAELVVYASIGKAARSWSAYHAIVDALLRLGDDETLLVQSGKAIGVLRTHPNAPVVVMACGNVVGRYATPAHFERHVAAGLTMWGGLTAGDWQYIGSQGVLQGVWEILGAVAREHLGGSIAGRLVVTAGLGGMGSAQPLAAKMHGANVIVAEVDEAKLQRRLAGGDLDAVTDDLGKALALVASATDPVAVGLAANAADMMVDLVTLEVTPAIVTDLTAAHDPLWGYVPSGMSVDEWRSGQLADPVGVSAAAQATMARQVEAMATLRERGAVVFENGNNLRAQAELGGYAGAFALDGFAERYLRPLFSRGIGPFRWVALSGDPADLAALDDLVLATITGRHEVATWIGLAREHVTIQGLPARTCWLGHGERSAFALAVNDAVADGRISAPVLFTRDHLDSAGMTHPHIGTEGMLDGSDAISDWPMLDAMVLCSAGADLVAIHAGGGGYSGFMQSAGVSIVADGTAAAAVRLEQGLDADTGLGVLRYADAGYAVAHDEIARAGIHAIDVAGPRTERIADPPTRMPAGPA